MTDEPTFLDAWWAERRLEPERPVPPDPGTPDELFDRSHWIRVYDAVTTGRPMPRFDMVRLRESVRSALDRARNVVSVAPPGPKEGEQ